MNQDMGPDRIRVRVTVQADVVIDRDEMVSVMAERWDDTLGHLQASGIGITKKVDILEEWTPPAKKKK